MSILPKPEGEPQLPVDLHLVEQAEEISPDESKRYTAMGKRALGVVGEEEAKDNGEVSDNDPLSILSKKERDVVGYVLQGASIAEIAASLYLAEDTVRFHLRNTCKKLGVNDKNELQILVNGDIQKSDLSPANEVIHEAVPSEAPENPENLSGLELLSELTKRELEVLGLSLQGKDNQQIADKLKVAKSTVTAHLKHIYPKLGVNSRFEMERKISPEDVKEAKAQSKPRKTSHSGRGGGSRSEPALSPERVVFSLGTKAARQLAAKMPEILEDDSLRFPLGNEPARRFLLEANAISEEEFEKGAVNAGALALILAVHSERGRGLFEGDDLEKRVNIVSEAITTEFAIVKKAITSARRGGSGR